MKITYIGGMPSGTLKDPISGKHYDFKRGEAFDVPEALAKEVIEAGIFEAAGKTAKGDKQ